MLKTAVRFGLRRVPVILIATTLLQMAADREAIENAKERKLRAKEDKEVGEILIRLAETESSTQADSTTNVCQSQNATNRKNGIQCEEDGYVLMEWHLKFKRLSDPPKARGLDGLFEKLPPMNLPLSRELRVDMPLPGRLRFVP